MLWIAIAIAITSPKMPVSPKEAPIPSPSAAECAVITAMISSAWRAAAPERWLTSSSPTRLSRTPTTYTKATPSTAPVAVRVTLPPPPSTSRLMLAPSITPAAIAFARPNHLVPLSSKNANGSAPSPVASAVNSAATNTNTMLPRLTSIDAATPRRG